uniref:Uncharacterized protein n=1 Tax=Oryza barthii TaxID=65489 RepID=A0A0D3GVX2_9ORYZ
MAASLELGVGTTTAFDRVALGGQCHQQLDGDGERLCVANKVDEMASRCSIKTAWAATGVMTICCSRTRAAQRRPCCCVVLNKSFWISVTRQHPRLLRRSPARRVGRSGITMVFSGRWVLVVSQCRVAALRPAFSSSALTMSVRKVAASSKMASRHPRRRRVEAAVGKATSSNI